jgi:hypothetical protein
VVVQRRLVLLVQCLGSRGRELHHGIVPTLRGRLGGLWLLPPRLRAWRRSNHDSWSIAVQTDMLVHCRLDVVRPLPDGLTVGHRARGLQWHRFAGFGMRRPSFLLPPFAPVEARCGALRLRHLCDVEILNLRHTIRHCARTWPDFGGGNTNREKEG